MAFFGDYTTELYCFSFSVWSARLQDNELSIKIHEQILETPCVVAFASWFGSLGVGGEPDQGSASHTIIVRTVPYVIRDVPADGYLI
jgi:hypothetical protein